MTKSQIIDAAQKLTEKILIDQIDFSLLFTSVLQEFCAEQRFWWRKKSLSFSTAGATPTYDLTAITTVPANAGIFVEEITKIFRIDGTSPCPLSPVTDDEAVAQMIADTVTTDKPGSWTIDIATSLTNFQTLRLSPIPNGVYAVKVYFWAMPNINQDSSDETVYIVPVTLHHVLVTAMEKEIWRSAYGEQNPKYLTALNLYNKKVQQARVKPSFAAAKESYFSNRSGEAIRSTR